MADIRTPLRVEVSYKTIIFAVGLLIGLWLLIEIRQIIILIFLSIILVSALLGPVEWLTSKGVPRVLSTIIVYLIIIAAFSTIIGIIVPPLVSQTSELINKLPQIISSINNFLTFNQIPEDVSGIISKQLNQLGGNVVSIFKTVFSSIVLVISLFVLSFYLILEWRKLMRTVTSSFSGQQERRFVNIFSKVEKGLGQWLRAQLVLSISVGILIYIGLRILGFPFAIPLALIAGLFEIVPIVGPVLSAVPSVLVGLSVTPIFAIAAIALFFVVQQIENHLIVPTIMSKVVGLQPPVVIIALLIGAKLYGIGGAFLAIPIMVVAKIIVKELLFEEGKEK